MTSNVCLTEFAKIQTSSNCPPDPEGNVFVVRNEEATALQVINELKSVGASAVFICLGCVVGQGSPSILLLDSVKRSRILYANSSGCMFKDLELTLQIVQCFLLRLLRVLRD